MHRRRFVHGGLSAAAAAAAGALAGVGTRLYAAQPGDSGSARFLLVFLRGGYDAASLLVPVSSDFYYASRPNIAVPRPSDAAGSALPLAADWGLHPVLEDNVAQLALGRQAVFVPFAGTDDLTRSHFETQDSIELGQPLGGRRDYASGFMNRLAAALGARNAIAFTDQLPLCFRGPVQIGNVSLKAVGRYGIDARSRDLLATMYRGQPLEAQVQEGFAVRDEVAREMAGEMQAANRNAISVKGFALEARRIDRLMRDKYNLGFIDVGGWDTHVNQGAASGYLASRLQELGRGLAGFADEMGQTVWRNTVVYVLSEFGRTFRENGNRGTDHGHGSVHWVLGGGLAAANDKIAGEQVAIDERGLFQNRDFPVLNEYRAVLGGLLGRMYGLRDEALAQVFPGAKAKDLRLV